VNAHTHAQALFQPYLDSLGAGSLRGVALFDVPLHANLGDGVLSAAAARLVPQFHTAIK
jgi:exopolysaccharide biosynthesis predicted pyruvyltransferase EpsI